MLNIVLPIAGRGSRFKDAGYSLPKPLIPVHGEAMIELVVRNVRPNRPHRFVFLALREHLEETALRSTLERAAPGCAIVEVNQVTEGAACTVLLARRVIDGADSLMIVNSDQWVDVDINKYLSFMDNDGSEGLIMTMWADHPKWSYVRLGADRLATEVVEKQVVSNEATVGIYNFKRGSEFVRAADQMIAANIRVNNEFYVAPVYNGLIKEGKRISIYNVGRVGAGMHGLGTPSDLDEFLKNPVSRKALAAVDTARPQH